MSAGENEPIDEEEEEEMPLSVGVRLFAKSGPAVTIPILGTLRLDL